MSCYHPNGVLCVNGEFSRFVGPLNTFRDKSFQDNGFEVLPVPCGKCIGCRLDKSKSWADRMLVEFLTPRSTYPAKTACFVTLTFEDYNVPYVRCTDGVFRKNLDIKYVQDFHKRLRQHYDRKLKKRLRFYYAGEYGDTTFRPHGHAIYYGMCLDDFDDLHIYKSTDYGILYRSPTFEKLWDSGQCLISEATYQTFAYVSRYVIKKQYVSEGSNMVYLGRQPPFSLKSTRPALGIDLFDDYDDPILILNDGHDVHRVNVPRIVSDKLSFTDPDLYAMIKLRKRNLCAGHSDLLKAQLGTDYYEYLNMLEDLHESRTANIKRDMEV